MFKDADVFASFSVNDVDKAKAFYTKVLGFRTEEVFGMLVMHFSDNNKVVAYPKPDHEPASFTVLNIPVDNIKKAMEKLRKSKVTFEIYKKGDTITDDEGVSTNDGSKAAWFKDPAGNLIALLEGI